LRDIKNLGKIKHEVYIYLKNPDLHIKIFLNIDNQTSIYTKGTVNKSFKDSYKFMYILKFQIFSVKFLVKLKLKTIRFNQFIIIIFTISFIIIDKKVYFPRLKQAYKYTYSCAVHENLLIIKLI